MGELTFSQLRLEVAQDASLDPSAHLLCLQSAASELAEVLRWRNGPQPFSDMDARRLAGGLGGLVVAAARLAEATGVDLAAAASARVQRDVRHRALRTSPSPVRAQPPLPPQPVLQPPKPPPQPQPPQRQPPQPQPQPQQQQLQPPQPAPPPQLPRPAHNAPVQLPKALLAQRVPPDQGLTSTIPQSVEIAPVPIPQNGLGANSRQRATAQRSGPSPVGLRETGRRPSFKRSLSVVVPRTQMMGASPDLYSPTHFQVDLFAPVTRQTDFEVEYGAPAPIVPSTLHKRDQDLPPAPLSPRTLKEDFFPMVEALQSQVFGPAEFDALDLTFCVPEPDGRIIDLIPNGRHVKVTLATRDEFVKLALEWRGKNSRTAGRGGSFGSSSPPSSVRGVSAMPAPLRPRPSLKRTLTVQLPKKDWDPERVRGLFSPTHFQHNLFSPYAAGTNFNVDYGAGSAQPCLPKSLSKPKLTTPELDSVSSPEPVNHGRTASGTSVDLQHRTSSGPVYLPCAVPPGAQPGFIRPRSPGRWLTPVHSASSFRRRSSIASGSCEEEEDDEEEYRGLDLLCEVGDEMARERELAAALADLDDTSTKGGSEEDGMALLKLEREFQPMIEMLEAMYAPDATERMDAKDLEEMGLTFVVPHAGVLHDLLPDGSKVPVTVDCLSEFVSLAKKKLSQLQSSGQSGQVAALL
eukprot:Hpha_TRINITY_DN15042_c3_g21::TRINITY_DN15042_c3_g21_i1::g.125815::m.125815